MTDQNGGTPLNWKGILLVLVPLAILGVGALLVLPKFEGQPPSLNLSPELTIMGKGTALTLSCEDPQSGLGEVRVDILQGDKGVPLFARTYGKENRRVEEALDLTPVSGVLGDGEALLRVVVRDRSWRGGGNRALLETKITIDLTPPTLEVLSPFDDVTLGGAGAVVYRASEEPVRNGVELGGMWFPGFSNGERTYLCLFAVPHDASPAIPIVLMADDRAGNQSQAILYFRIRQRTSGDDYLVLTDELLQSTMAYFTQRDPSLRGDLLEAFLRVNRDLRAISHERLRALCRETASEPLWSGPFLRMANAQTTSGFAHRRIFIYGEREVDRQFHLGVDLASLANSPVRAANRGRVAFADELGIYGHTVLLDHGCGLFSMYSHMSRSEVRAGQMVEKGQLLGLTGTTGLTTGDHLHFSVLVSGIFVNPVEWWDAKWVEEHVDRHLALLRGGK